MTNYKEAVIMPAVKRGAELLDEVLPGWAKAINVRLLNLATPFPVNVSNANGVEGTGCILCQLDHYLDTELDKRLPNTPIRLSEFGVYVDGLTALKEIVDPDFDEGFHGFDILDEWEDPDTLDWWENDYDSSDYYRILDSLWKEEIELRLENTN
jgi:hypothetical protein